ncbi:MAG TPA: NAD-dependent epimerase/dehydratase family protein [Acidimicrobiia bacterium]|nr:NAD-dependent epimerase/dehydratase family protein [Acidimicrobiia bacterium]
MSRVFLTGATGMIGSNIAEQLVEQGDAVCALVRAGSETGPLEAFGVEVVRGDITDPDAVLRAADGCEYVVHSAAVLGGQTQIAGEHEAVNVVGTGHVLDAAAKVGATRVVQLSTTTFFDARRAPLTEHSPLDPAPSDDPYTVTKRAAYLDAMRRVDDGQDICIVISGGAYGRSPLPERSMVAPSYNARIALALRGDITEYVGFPIPWVDAGDVAHASVVATRKGVAGERYLAFGRPGDVGGVPYFCNVALEIAGSPQRVTEVAVEELDDPEVAARFGPSLVALARKRFPTPFFVNDQTVERLGYAPRTLHEGLERTIPWMREHGLL